MQLQHQVCTLEQAKRLKELGIVQQSLFFMDQKGTIRVCIEGLSMEKDFAIPVPLQKPIVNYNVVAAFTVAELCEMMPFYLVGFGQLTIRKNYRRDNLTGWNVRYEKTINFEENALPVFCAETQAKAVALMLIHLLETNLITPAQCNERIK